MCVRKVQGKYGIIWSIEQKGISHSGAENQFLRECYRKWLNIRSLVSREKKEEKSLRIPRFEIQIKLSVLKRIITGMGFLSPSIPFKLESIDFLFFLSMNNLKA